MDPWAVAAHAEHDALLLAGDLSGEVGCGGAAAGGGQERIRRRKG